MDAEEVGTAILMKKLVDAEAEVFALKEEREKLIWNLAGISTLATSRVPVNFNPEWARAALHDTLKLVNAFVLLGYEAEGLRKQLSIESHYVAEYRKAYCKSVANEQRLRAAMLTAGVPIPAEPEVDNG